MCPSVCHLVHVLLVMWLDEYTAGDSVPANEGFCFTNYRMECKEILLVEMTKWCKRTKSNLGGKSQDFHSVAQCCKNWCVSLSAYMQFVHCAFSNFTSLCMVAMTPAMGTCRELTAWLVLWPLRALTLMTSAVGCHLSMLTTPTVLVFNCVWYYEKSQHNTDIVLDNCWGDLSVRKATLHCANALLCVAFFARIYARNLECNLKQVCYETIRPPGEFKTGSTQTLKRTNKCKVFFCTWMQRHRNNRTWVKVLQRTNIIALCKHGLANRLRDSFVCVVSFCLASSRHRLTGKASRLYLFINLLGTGNERQGQYISLYMCAHTYTLHTTLQSTYSSIAEHICSK